MEGEGGVEERPDVGGAETGEALAIKLQSQMREPGGNRPCRCKAGDCYSEAASDKHSVEAPR